MLPQVQRRIEERQVEYNESCMKTMMRTPAVAFSVGDVIRHKRYNYRGVIFDWDPMCNVKEDWIQQMGVSALDQMYGVG